MKLSGCMFHRLASDEVDCVSLTDWLEMKLTVYVFHRLGSDEADCVCVSQTG